LDQEELGVRRVAESSFRRDAARELGGEVEHVGALDKRRGGRLGLGAANPAEQVGERDRPIVATGVAMLLFASELSRFIKSWNDPRIYDKWPKSGVFPKPDDEGPGETSVPPKRASPPNRPPKD
jgi:hypothetical protein